MIWFKEYTLEFLQEKRVANMGHHCGIELTEIGSDFLRGIMPVDHRTVQAFGILHGGANCVLAETLGSISSWMTIDPDHYRAVGIEINCNHIRAVTEGNVVGTCRPIHTGRRTQVWEIDITEEKSGKRVASSKLTLSIIDQGTLSAQKEAVHVHK